MSENVSSAVPVQKVGLADPKLPPEINPDVLDPRYKWDEAGFIQNWNLTANFVSYLLAMMSAAPKEDLAVLVELRVLNVVTNETGSQRLTFPATLFDGVPYPPDMLPSPVDYQEVMKQAREMNVRPTRQQIVEALQLDENGKPVGLKLIKT